MKPSLTPSLLHPISPGTAVRVTEGGGFVRYGARTERRDTVQTARRVNRIHVNGFVWKSRKHDLT